MQVSARPSFALNSFGNANFSTTKLQSFGTTSSTTQVTLVRPSQSINIKLLLMSPSKKCRTRKLENINLPM
jgi:hypothetical protein